MFLLLVKRLTSLKYNSSPQQQQQQQETLRLNYSNRLSDKQNQNRNSKQKSGEVQANLSSFKPENEISKNCLEGREKNDKLLNDGQHCDGKLSEKHQQQIVVNEKEQEEADKQANSENQSMGSNVSRPSSGKGLSGRRTQSSSEYFPHKNN